MLITPLNVLLAVAVRNFCGEFKKGQEILEKRRGFDKGRCVKEEGRKGKGTGKDR